MNPETRLLIDGELVPAVSGRTYPNINPATEEIMGEVADAGPDVVASIRKVHERRKTLGIYRED